MQKKYLWIVVGAFVLAAVFLYVVSSKMQYPDQAVNREKANINTSMSTDEMPSEEDDDINAITNDVESSLDEEMEAIDAEIESIESSVSSSDDVPSESELGL